jgi:hypothetical protein
MHRFHRPDHLPHGKGERRERFHLGRAKWRGLAGSTTTRWRADAPICSGPRGVFLLPLCRHVVAVRSPCLFPSVSSRCRQQGLQHGNGKPQLHDTRKVSPEAGVGYRISIPGADRPLRSLNCRAVHASTITGSNSSDELTPEADTSEISITSGFEGTRLETTDALVRKSSSMRERTSEQNTSSVDGQTEEATDRHGERGRKQRRDSGAEAATSRT